MIGYFFGRLLYESFRAFAYVVYFTAAFLIASAFYIVYFTIIGIVVGSMKIAQWYMEYRREKFDRENESISNDPLQTWRFK